MKKILATLLALALCVGMFGGCNNKSECDCGQNCDCKNSSNDIGSAQGGSANNGNGSSSGGLTDEAGKMSMLVGYDYGMHVENEATLLLDYCNIFFNPADYGIDTLVAGDVVTVEYDGVIYIEEMYPGNVVTKDATIKNITVFETRVLELEVWEVPGGGYNVMVESGNGYQSVACAKNYVINADGTFETLGEKHRNMTLYGSDTVNMSSIYIQALYSYNPRPETPTFNHTCALVCLEEITPTCLAEGKSIIGCTYCGDIYEETILEKVACQLDENGKCIWCEQTLSDLYTWINDLTVDDIDSMQLENVTYGVEPGMRVNSRMMTWDLQDKENMLSYLKNLRLKAVSGEEAAIEGGGGVRLTIYHATCDVLYVLSISNGYLYINGIYYQPLAEMPSFGENAVICQACCLCGSFDCNGYE